MKVFIMLLCTALISPACLFSQKITISGSVTDTKTGETMLSANVYEALTLSGTVTNNYGFYSIKAPKGKVKLVCSFIGYATFSHEFIVMSDTTINIELNPDMQIEEVVVTDKGPQRTVQSTQMSTVELPILKTKQLPVLLGEVDPIKSLQLMPGVQSGTEGSTGLYVRGGGPDQNLILLDGVPVYNVNHLFGFFSVFNADAIKNVSLIKGGFPARYGGRLSSVIDIRMKEGNMKEFKGDASIGVLSSGLTLQGPIIKDRTSFIVSGRRTYFDVLTYPVQALVARAQQGQGYNSRTGFYFYDLNAKVNHIVNDKNRIYLSAYTGRDKFYLEENQKLDNPTDRKYYRNTNEGGINWGNITAALRWNRVYSSSLFGNLTLTYSNYSFITQYLSDYASADDTARIAQKYQFKYLSQIRDLAFKYDFEHRISDNHYLRYGLNNTLHTFSPGVTVNFEAYNSDVSIDTTYGRKNIPSNEFYVYAEDEFNLGNRLRVNSGLHYSNFKTGDTLYHSLEPRISARYMVNDNFSAKLSFVRMTQYINLLANTTIGLPTDLWVPCTKKIYPQKSWQVAAGTAHGIGNGYELTVEAYYKKMNKLVEYIEGASFFNLDTDWESVVTQGKGESYGAELFFQKTLGKTTGWIGYTLSWTNRQFDSISFGKTFPYKYDRRHDASLVITHNFNDMVNLGLAWVYGTGTALTLTEENYVSHEWIMHGNRNFFYGPNDEFTGTFATRNSYRMPAYHRLDIGINFSKEKKYFKRTWGIGVYNCYARKNAFYVYPSIEYDESVADWKPVLKQVSILNFIPYLRYNISF
ncbi:MAG: carboxypeptidase-like regulatory domain-containing protein [Bacteroidales bacterium]|nr:carboxypeptidase-like regulatory domain-containing protein [Bacteroidales bacterium]